MFSLHFKITQRGRWVHTEVGHDVPELSSTDVTVSVLVENLERFLDLLFAIGVPHFTRHHREELREIDRSITISIDLVDHVLKFRLSGILAQGTHDGPKLLGGDRAIAVCKHEAISITFRHTTSVVKHTFIEQ